MHATVCLSTYWYLIARLSPGWVHIYQILPSPYRQFTTDTQVSVGGTLQKNVTVENGADAKRRTPAAYRSINPY